jgi:UDP-N-acetylmuramoyl-L-alanyl-D-glutamate--2,6-diaminopimelate ligase
MNLNKLPSIIYKYTNLIINESIKDIFDNTMDLEPNSILVLFNPVSTNKEKYINNIICHVENIKPPVTLFIDGSEKYFNNYMDKFQLTGNITEETLELIINEYYSNSPKEIIGVTGSCGKTSTCIFLQELLEKNHIKNLLVTSIKIEGIKNNFNIRNTTPSWITLKQLLHNSYEANINIAIIEVSSLGIKDNRIKGINFTGGIWTSFNLDHLETHGTLENYFETKKSFIEKLPIKVVNENVNKYKEHLKILNKDIIFYGSNLNQIKDEGFTYNNINYNKTFNVKFFQQENLLGAMILLYNLGYKNIFDYTDINKIVASRMEFFGTSSNGSLVYSDGAYRPDGINKVIDYFKPFNLKRVILIMGAGGDRDRGKDYRKNIGRLSSKVLKLIVTDDNPRSENPIDIRNEIIDNDGDSNNIINIGNRFEALNYAFRIPNKNHIILILSHGSSDTVLYNNHYMLMSDLDIFKQDAFSKELKNLNMD